MIDVAVLGATGAVGQRFLALLEGHPWFQVTQLAAGPGRVGTPFAGVEWKLDTPRPAGLDDILLRAPEDATARVAFSALPSDIARAVEPALAAKGVAVFTNASPHRMDPDVPLVIPEVNRDHLQQVAGRKGFIVANGNCSGIILTLALAPLARAFGLESVDVVTQQALSGAGFDGVARADIDDNILPLIPGEEEKLQVEPQKTLGIDFPIRATCTRVDVTDGHFETVHATLGRPATRDEVQAAFRAFPALDLPSAPHPPIVVLEGDRPQPRLDRMLGNGMAVGVGRIRCEGTRLQFVVLGHNTIRGAAGQSLLNAECAREAGLLTVHGEPLAEAQAKRQGDQ